MAESRAVRVGVGFRSGVTCEDIVSAVHAIIGDRWEVASLATLDRKAADPALTDAAHRLGVSVRGFTARELAAVNVPHPADRVARETGSPSVAEAAAILGAGGGELVVTKTSANGVVVAAARRVFEVR